MELSIVTTLYRSALYLEEFYRRACAAAEKIARDFEIILVNDGSPDNSLEVALSLVERDARVKVIDLSRNFGHHKAMMTGLARARGELVFKIDCDLEEDPDLLVTFHAAIKESGADAVYGVQEARRGRWWERVSGALFWKLFNVLSNVPVPANLLTVNMMTQKYVASLVRHQEREVFLAGLSAITGFKQVPLVVRKHSKGQSTYTLSRKIALLVNAITSFSNKPLIFIFYLGAFISFISGAFALHLIVDALFFKGYLGGWPSLIVSIWLLGGMTIFCLGIIGIYLSKVFVETKQRPYTIIRDLYDRSDAFNLKALDNAGACRDGAGDRKGMEAAR
jgi:putative glycosyltransferase